MQSSIVRLASDDAMCRHVDSKVRPVSPQFVVGNEWLVESEAAHHFGALAEFRFVAMCLTEGVRSMSRRRDHEACKVQSTG